MCVVLHRILSSFTVNSVSTLPKFLFSLPFALLRMWETLLAGCLSSWAHIPVQIFVLFLNYISTISSSQTEHILYKRQTNKEVCKRSSSIFLHSYHGRWASPTMSALWYESCDNDEKLMDFYLYQSDDHRPCYFYYFFKKGIGAAWIWRHIFTAFLRFIGTGATKPSLLSEIDKLSSMQFTM